MRLRLAVAALAATLLPAAPALAAGDPTMPLSQVHSGMRCTGYSVVRGTDIASFDVDVIDVVDGDPNEDGPRILVQVSGPAVDATGIGPGFSGSPIYCDDGTGTQRNIGAISESIGEYGGKTVLATPIEAILSNPVDAPRGRSDTAHATTRGERAAAARASRAGAARRAARTNRAGATRRAARTSRAARLRDRTGDPRAAAALRAIRRGDVRRLASPLTVSGLSRGLADRLAAAGKRLGRPVLSAPAGPLGSFPVQPMRPGAAVSVGYSSGDLRIGAIGTVAYVDGSSVWAFGHPFEDSGARSLFLQDAYVYKVINDPNAALDGGSYKYASAGHDVGTLTNDASDAVVGRTGALPPTIPVRVAAHDRDTGRSLLLRVASADETDAGNTTGFSPVSTVAPLTIAQAGTNVLRSSPGRLTGRMCMTIVFREIKRHARFCNRYLSGSSADAQDSSGNAVAFDGALDAADALGLVDSYTGRTPHVTKVSAKLDIERGERSAELRNVRAPARVRAGQAIRVRVGMQKLRGPRITRTYTVRLPRGVKPGRHRLVLRAHDGSSGSADDLFSLLLTLDTGKPDPGPRTLRGLVAAIHALGRADGVDVKLAGRTRKGFRDDNLIISGRVTTPVRVVR